MVVIFSTYRINNNLHNFISSHEIDINFKPLSNFDQRNKMSRFGIIIIYLFIVDQ